MEVVSKNNGALVCKFGEHNEVRGFISALDSKYDLKYEQYEEIQVGQYLLCNTFEYNYEHESFQLKYMEVINE